MKTFRLLVHQKTFREDELILYIKDYSSFSIGDVIEIYSPDDEFSRLLLQIKSFPDEKENQPKEKPSISIEQSISNTFQLRPYGDVIVNKVDPNSVSLDSVEVIFKDQYLSRSDMWRIRNSLMNKVVFLNKKFETSIRFHVFEMWSQGEKVASGYINNETKIVFRSASSMVYLFVQMSSEMWDFDVNGDLYFEKAINGFLSDLFEKWKRFNCNHDVTIVMFSRTYYEAESIEEFPEEMRDCLQQDYKNKFYEDFYRVAIQNERYEEWNSTIVLLKKIFSNYEKEVLKYHEKYSKKVPKAYNSTASQGNFLEVLNMSLNVFEKHYLDRSFDRTGQLSIVISPGVGVFEVDSNLTSITKQRIIDNGIGSDLVCLGEQPLHAVPLFKYNKRHNVSNSNYNMPHWINLSFYTSKRQSRSSTFIPRIKMPNIVSKTEVINVNLNSEVSNDYDNYDENVFCSNKLINLENEKSLAIKRKKSVINTSFSLGSNINSNLINKKIDETDSLKTKVFEKKDDLKTINPFNPNQIPFKLTSNRRRWTHVFPLGPQGIFMQQHHFRTFPQNTACTLLPIDSSNDVSLKRTSSTYHLNSLKSENISLLNAINLTNSDVVDYDYNKIPDTITLNSFIGKDIDRKISFSEKFRNKNYSSIKFDYCQEENFVLTTSLITGVDWKSLIIPACLPLTTDFLPDTKSLENDYLDSEYDLIPEYQMADLYEKRCYKDDDHHSHCLFKTEQVFQEFICQRLQQGFQIIMSSSLQKSYLSSSTPIQSITTNKTKIDNSSKPKNTDDFILREKSYVMSIGRIFHRLDFDSTTAKVKILRPRNYFNNNIKIHYCYRFRAPDQETYGVSWVDFVTEKLENYNWNYLDNYICLRGEESEYELRENLKFWRLRMLLLPSMQQQTKQILENISSNNENFTCDIYNKISNEEKITLQKGFLKFFSIINRIKSQTNKPLPNKEIIKSSIESRRYSSGFQNVTCFRERFNSANTIDRPKKNLTFTLDKTKDDEFAVEADFKNSAENISTAGVLKKISPQNSGNIVDAMKNQYNNFIFLPKQGNLPDFLFISSDAVNWAIQTIESISNEKQALILLQKLLDQKYICHASGQINYPFKYGFFLYYIVIKNSKLPDDRVDLEMYKKEWFEVELSLNNSSSSSNNNISIVNETPKLSRLKNPITSIRSISSSLSLNSSLKDTTNLNKQPSKSTSYCRSVLDTDFGLKSKRPEWLHIKYQQVYNPLQAFEIVLEWMVSTSNQIVEIVQGWARKTGPTGLHLVPIPSDPFALPFHSKSDPLRAPIYISLNFDCLPSNISECLLTDDTKLLNYREEILSKFGFLPFLGGIKEDQKQYVHVSGSIFVLIPNFSKEKIKKSPQLDSNSPHEKYLTRHFSGSKQNKKGLENLRTGFLWSWNYMISKRWKSITTGDETFQRRVLKDFRLFCMNDNDRLKEFTERCQFIFD